ncbi:X-ray radiation resistance-associated protein 1-like [Rhinoraja longicauda]
MGGTEEGKEEKGKEEEVAKLGMKEEETAKQEVEEEETVKREVEEEETVKREMDKEEREEEEVDMEEREEEEVEVDKDMDGENAESDDENKEGGDMYHSLHQPSLGRTSSAIKSQDSMKTLEVKRLCFPNPLYDLLPPFSALTHLSLASNKISDDEELLAICLFPALTKLNIYNNPIIHNAGKKPQLVVTMLKERLGMEVVTTKPQAAARPPPLKAFNPKRKVDTRILKIPRQPLMLETARRLLGLESAGPGPGPGGAHPGEAGAGAGAGAEAAGHAGTEPASAPQDGGTTEGSDPDPTTSTTNTAPEKQPGEATAKGGPAEGFFMTQVEDAAFSTEDMVVLEAKQTEGPSVATDVPERYRGYEELLDATTDPYFVEPVGIQRNVRQLEWRLRKLQLYPDPFATVNLQQERAQPMHRKPQKLPEPTTRRSKAEQMEEILRTMREQRALTVMPLAQVLRAKDASSQDYREATVLLRVMQQKYSEVRRRLTDNFNRLQEECVEQKGNVPEAEQPPHSFTHVEGPSCNWD